MTPAMTTPGSRRTGILGAFALLEAHEQMVRSLATRPGAGGDPELPAVLACDLETPEMYAQAHAGLHGRIWGAAAPGVRRTYSDGNIQTGGGESVSVIQPYFF